MKFSLKFLIVLPSIPRYALLLSELFKNTRRDHPDYPNLQQALGKVRELADYINKMKARAENSRKVVEIAKKLTGISEVKIHFS